MEKISFNVDAYTARLIGRENLSKLDSAIIELVKNSYDADASDCIIYYDTRKRILYLADNGCGMDRETILNHWMTIGNSSKVKKYVSEKGRIQTGAKGIGRFALDRISNKCVMITKNKEYCLKWKVDWNVFSEHKKITDTYAEIQEINTDFKEFIDEIDNKDVRLLMQQNFNETGTVFKLTDLEDDWDETIISKLKNSLQTLVPPSLINAFKMYFFIDNSMKEDALLTSYIMDTYDYKINFECKNQNVRILIHRNEFDFRGKFDEIIQKCNFTCEDINYFKGENIEYNKKLIDLIPGLTEEDITNIGDFSGVLYFYKISSNKEDKNKFYYKDTYIRKNLTRDFGGIKIYRDEFKVRPYGDPGSANFDWLMLSSRKTKSPAAISSTNGQWRVRGEQMIGEINLSRRNLSIYDQANREGIVETKEFSQFKEAILSIISLFEKDRQYVIRKLNDLYIKENLAEEYKKEIKQKIKTTEDNISKNIDTQKEKSIPIHKVKAVIEQNEEQIRNLEDEIALLRALATTGIVTNAYIHEVKTLNNKLFTHIVLAKEVLEREPLEGEDLKDVKYDVDKAYSFNDRLTSWFDVTINSVRKDRRKMKKTNIYELINSLVYGLQSVIYNKNIKIKLSGNQDILVRCFSYEIESIINNLIANSMSAFEHDKNPRNEKSISIHIENIKENAFKIVYEDNGPGLAEAYKKDPYIILQSLETSKRNSSGEKIGTGMGMWIVNNILDEYKGRIDLNDNINSESGFKATLYFNERKNV